MTAKFVDDVEVIDPLPVSVDGLDGVVASLLTNLPAQEQGI